MFEDPRLKLEQDHDRKLVGASAGEKENTVELSWGKSSTEDMIGKSSRVFQMSD
jgi:hypothetical protein